MSIVFLNTRKAQTTVASIIGAGLLVYGGVRGGEAIAHAVHTAQAHQGHNMVYSITGCGIPFGGDGTEWDVTFFMHNGNADQVNGWSVQAEFDVAGRAVGYSKVLDMGDFDPGRVKSFHMEGEVDQKVTAPVSCKLLFSYNDKPAGGTSPVEAGG